MGDPLGHWTQLAAVEEDYGAVVYEISKASGSAFYFLNLAVEPFARCIRDWLNDVVE